MQTNSSDEALAHLKYDTAGAQTGDSHVKPCEEMSK